MLIKVLKYLKPLVNQLSCKVGKALTKIIES